MGGIRKVVHPIIWSLTWRQIIGAENVQVLLREILKVLRTKDVPNPLGRKSYLNQQ